MSKREHPKIVPAVLKTTTAHPQKKIIFLKISLILLSLVFVGFCWFIGSHYGKKNITIGPIYSTDHRNTVIFKLPYINNKNQNVESYKFAKVYGYVFAQKNPISQSKQQNLFKKFFNKSKNTKNLLSNIKAQKKSSMRLEFKEYDQYAVSNIAKIIDEIDISFYPKKDKSKKEIFHFWLIGVFEQFLRNSSFFILAITGYIVLFRIFCGKEVYSLFLWEWICFCQLTGIMLLMNFHITSGFTRGFFYVIDQFVFHIDKSAQLQLFDTISTISKVLFFILFFIVVPVIFFIFLFVITVVRRFKKSDSTFIRGAFMVNGNGTEETLLDLAYQETKNNKKGVKIWGEVFLPRSLETQHLLIVGSTGAGKTQVIHPIIQQIIDRGEKVIIWDVKGTYIQAFAEKEGVDLLAPWDKRSIKWRPGADILNTLDCQQAASIIVPENARDPQPFFSNSARHILESVFIQLDSSGDDWGWDDVWGVIAQGKEHLIKTLQQTHDGRSSVTAIEGDTKGAQDVYSTLLSSCQSIRWLSKAWLNEGISLREWIKSDGKNNTLILGGTPNYQKLSSATANLAIQTMINEILSMPDDSNRRIWFFLDELATLGCNDSLLQAFAMGRSKGLCVVGGIQDIGKIEHLYGMSLAKSITNTFSTTVFLRCSDIATSRWASEVIGEQEVEDYQSTTESFSNDLIVGKTRSGSSTQETIKQKHVFLPSEISNFKNLEGVLRISGWPVAYLQWPYRTISQDIPLIVEADWVSQKVKIDKPKNQLNKNAQWRV